MNEAGTGGSGGEESFEQLLDQYVEGAGESLRVGDLVKGRVIDLSGESIFIDTGSKVDGVADREEFLDDNGELPFAVGDEVELYVVEMGHGVVKLSKALSGVGGLNALKEAYESKLPVEGRVAETCKGGFRVEMVHRKAFCPVSQIDNRYVENPEEYVGQALEFLIIKFEERGRNIVVSRRELLDRQQAEASKEFLGEHKPGEEVSGKVTRIEPYGAFVELAPGLDGLVHISELTHGRLGDPSEAVSVGDVIDVKILSVENDKSGKLRISLSAKEAAPDPWDSVADKFAAGDKVTGTVIRLAPFGAFVELAPGVDGLVHISELSYVRRVAKPDDVVSVGEEITVKIKDIDLENRRISLSLKEAEGDPWTHAAGNFPIGSRVEGTVEKQESFGVFVNVAPGITGLLPKSRIAAAASGAEEAKRAKPGDTLTVVVERVDMAERKMSLGLPGSEEDAGDWKAHAKQGGGQSMGLLGEKLAEAMKKK